VRRAIVVMTFALVSVGCTQVGDVTDVLSPGPTGTPSPPLVTGPTALTTAPDGKPAIVVRTPQPGDEIVSPVTVSGSANVFEGTVTIEIVGADGLQLAATSATATCGSGCRGRYSAEVAFYVPRRQDATIRAYEVSAEDGTELNVVEVQVVLVPGS
jgi:hypothetical protein